MNEREHVMRFVDRELDWKGRVLFLVRLSVRPDLRQDVRTWRALSEALQTLRPDHSGDTRSRRSG